MRTYAYICSLGGDGLKDVSRTAVLNANYLKALLAQEGIGEYLPVAFDRHCMHEFVLSGSGAKEQLGVRTLDLAKRMLDHRVHPPTVYFPLLVDEALMIEPTETETKERLDHFAERDPRDPGRGEGGSRRSPARRRTRRPCAASTRRAPRSARWCAGAPTRRTRENRSAPARRQRAAPAAM